MKAKIRITKVEKDIELEFEYETVDELCEIYDYITQEPVAVNEQGGGLEGALDKIKKALDEQGTCKPAHTPIWQYPHFTIGGYTYKPYPPQPFTSEDM